MPDDHRPENPFGHKELKELERNDPVRKWMARIAIPLLLIGGLMQYFNSESVPEAPAATETPQVTAAPVQKPTLP